MSKSITEPLSSILEQQSIYYHTNTFEKDKYTQDTATRIINKYKNRLPVLLWQIGPDIKIKKRKFIVPRDLTIGQFLYVLRKQMDKMTATEGLFIFVHDKNSMLPVTAMIDKVYNENNIDGFLRLTITKENTFG